MVNDDRPGTGRGRSGSLDDLVLELLGEGGAHVGFSGLRRNLAVHPESLTRALRRLERRGEIGRDARGYFVREPGHRAPDPAALTELASVRLPEALSNDMVLGALAGRWYRGLRWVGTFDAHRPPSLVWAADGVEAHLLLQVDGDRLRISAAGVGAPGDPSRLALAADELLWHALDRLRSLVPGSAPELAGAPRGTLRRKPSSSHDAWAS